MSITFAKGAALLGDRFGGRSMDNDRTVTVNSEAPATRRRFLVIGDDKKVGQALQTVFDEPYDVVRAANAEEALRALAGRGADVVLFDQGTLGQSDPVVAHSPDCHTLPAASMANNPRAVKVLGDVMKALSGARRQGSSVPAASRKGP